MKNFYDFWEQEVLKDRPHKDNLLKWIKGVEIEEFSNSFTSTEFQGEKLHSYHLQATQSPNCVPEEFIPFMDK